MRLLFRSSHARITLIAFATFFAISLLSRIILGLTSIRDLNWDASIAGAFACGACYDAAAAIFASLPWVFLSALTPVSWLKSRVGHILQLGLMTLYVGMLIFITTAEWFFWDEFGVRFNMIAVDYLLWTQEVLTNIVQSYPMVPIFSGIIALAVMVVWFMNRSGLLPWAQNAPSSPLARTFWPLACLAVAALAVRFVDQTSLPAFTNPYHGELAKNGCWSFFAALRNMELEYTVWYSSLPQDQALREAKHLLVTPNESATSPAPDELKRSIRTSGPEHQRNVIIICMESMSGEYLTASSKKSAITPNLNRLAKESLFFNNLYATGTRTVRGMEAITLGLPPTPGHAIIYRPEGTHLVTTFTPFLDRGYDCAFFYGGEGRFDFMNRYFSTSGCRIMDATAWDPRDVSFKTAWGACDEDLYHKVIASADANHASAKPFHFFCMTTSNHRPYDFPANRIDMPSHRKKAAVKYADWALGNFLDEAVKHPWFKNTLFVIIADHCASSAGKTELEVTHYQIPAMIYNPELVPAHTVTTLCSQIDAMPTVFGLLNWSHDTLGYGHDLLAPCASNIPGRAFISNYQKIALLRDKGIAILMPSRKNSAYTCDRASGAYTPMDPSTSASMLHDTGVFYQSACWLFDNGKLKQPAAAPTAAGH